MAGHILPLSPHAAPGVRRRHGPRKPSSRLGGLVQEGCGPLFQLGREPSRIVAHAGKPCAKQGIGKEVPNLFQLQGKSGRRFRKEASGIRVPGGGPFLRRIRENALHEGPEHLPKPRKARPAAQAQRIQGFRDQLRRAGTSLARRPTGRILPVQASGGLRIRVQKAAPACPVEIRKGLVVDHHRGVQSGNGDRAGRIPQQGIRASCHHLRHEIGQLHAQASGTRGRRRIAGASLFGIITMRRFFLDFLLIMSHGTSLLHAFQRMQTRVYKLLALAEEPILTSKHAGCSIKRGWLPAIDRQAARVLATRCNSESIQRAAQVPHHVEHIHYRHTELIRYIGYLGL